MLIKCSKKIVVEMVNIPNLPIEMGKYPITQSQYEAVMGINPSYFSDNPNNPIERVSWSEAVEFCNRLSQLTGQSYRLPTESEWEYACRAGTTTPFHFGDDESQLGDYAWFYKNSSNKTHPVGEKGANPWGLHDMYGNVWEWCADYSDDDSKPVRGSSWCSDPRGCRSTCNVNFSPNFRNLYTGFRVVCEI